MNVNNISQVNRCQWGAGLPQTNTNIQSAATNLANVLKGLGDNKGDSSFLQKLGTALVSCFMSLAGGNASEKAVKSTDADKIISKKLFFMYLLLK